MKLISRVLVLTKVNILCGTNDEHRKGWKELGSGLGNIGESTEILNIYQSRRFNKISRIFLRDIF